MSWLGKKISELSDAEIMDIQRLLTWLGVIGLVGSAISIIAMFFHLGLDLRRHDPATLQLLEGGK